MNGYCERKPSLILPEIKKISIGDKNKVEIKLCPVKNCGDDLCKNGQESFGSTPCLVSCRDLSSFYQKVNTSVDNFGGLQNLAKNTVGINEKCTKHQNYDSGGCFCPTGQLLRVDLMQRRKRLHPLKRAKKG